MSYVSRLRHGVQHVSNSECAMNVPQRDLMTTYFNSIVQPSVKSDESATESPSHRAPSEWTLDEWDVLTEPPSETNLQHSQLLERMHALEVEVARLKLALAQQGGASTSTATCDVPLNAVASIEDGLETSSSGSIPCSKAATDPFIEGSEVEVLIPNLYYNASSFPPASLQVTRVDMHCSFLHIDSFVLSDSY